MALVIGGAALAAILGLVVLNAVGRRVGAFMRRHLGGLAEFLAIFYVIMGCGAALLAVLYFVVPFPVWLAVTVLVVLLTVFVVELM